jgi:hypothetical protein
MTDVFIDAIIKDDQTGRNIGISFDLLVSQGEATISIREVPPSLEISQRETFPAVLQELGQALIEAAQNPERIHWYPRELKKAQSD